MKFVYNNKIYIKIYKNKIIFRCLTTDKKSIIDDVNFSNDRYLVANLRDLVEKIDKSIKDVTKKSGFKGMFFRYDIVLHPMVVYEDKLCDGEIIIYSELVRGYKNLAIFIGDELNKNEVYELIKLYEKKFNYDNPMAYTIKKNGEFRVINRMLDE